MPNPISKVTPQRKRKSGRVKLGPSGQDAVNAGKTSLPGFTVNQRTDQDHTIIKAQSQRRGVQFNPKFNDLLSVIAPKIRYRYDGFGYNRALIVPDTTVAPDFPVRQSDGTLKIHPTDLNSTKGHWRDCIWESGQQYWFEQTALPYVKKVADGSILSVVEMLDKYQDVRYQSMLSGGTSDHGQQFSAAYFSLHPGDDSFMTNLTKGKMCYYGGTQTHNFYNYQPYDMYIELWELQPRRLLSDCYDFNLAAGTAKYDTVYRNALDDYLDMKTRTNYWDPVQQGPSMFDERTDIGFRLNGNLKRTNNKYVVGKPILATVPPGGVFKYTVNLPSFSFDGPDFITMLISNDDKANDVVGNVESQNYIVERRPNLIPMFSRVLCGRMWSPIGRKQMAVTGVQPDGSTSESVESVAVGNAPGRFLHTMSEYHEWRVFPTANPNNYIRNYQLDTVADINLVAIHKEAALSQGDGNVDNQYDLNQGNDSAGAVENNDIVMMTTP